MNSRSANLHDALGNLDEEMSERLVRKNFCESFARDRERNGRFREIIERIKERGIRPVDPGGVCVIGLERIAVQICIEPLLIVLRDRFKQRVPVSVIFRESFQGLPIFFQKSIEGVLAFIEALFINLPEFEVIVDAKGPQTAHERRDDEHDEKRDLGLNFHRHLIIPTHPIGGLSAKPASIRRAL